jgi:hypothetical protein
MTFRMPNATAIARCDALVDQLDAGSSETEGYVNIYTGTQPAAGDAAASGTLLVTIPLQNPAFGAASDQDPGAQASMNGTPSGVASVGGGPLTAGWYRAFDRDDNPVCDGSVSESGGGGEMIIDNDSVADAATVTITAWTHTEPESA